MSGLRLLCLLCPALWLAAMPVQAEIVPAPSAVASAASAPAAPPPAASASAPAPGLALPDLRDLGIAVPRPVRAATAALGLGRRRLALVVGIGTIGTRRVVDSAPRDVQAVAAALRAGGFVVMLREDIAGADLRASLAEFAQRLQPGDVGLAYFAGLAVQVEGRNLLLPRDAVLNAAQPRALELAGVPLAEVANALVGTSDSPRLLIVDGAYRHPALAALPAPGLAEQHLPPGVMALFGLALGTTQDVPAAAPLPEPAPGAAAEIAASAFARVFVGRLLTPRISGPEALRSTRRAIADADLGREPPWIGGDTESHEELAEESLFDSMVPRTPGDLLREAARELPRLLSHPAGAQAVSTAGSTLASAGEQSVADVLAHAAPAAGPAAVPAAAGAATSATAAASSGAAAVPSVAPAVEATAAAPAATVATPAAAAAQAAAVAAASPAPVAQLLGHAAGAAGTAAGVAGTAVAVAAGVKVAEATAAVSAASTAAGAAAAVGATAGQVAALALRAATPGSSDPPLREAPVQNAAATPAATAAAAPMPVAGVGSGPAPTSAAAAATATAARSTAATAAANAAPSTAAAAAAQETAGAAAAPAVADAAALAAGSAAAAGSVAVASAGAPPAPGGGAAGTDGRTTRVADGGERPVYLPRRNAYGYAEGDTYTYQVIDGWKGEVSGRYVTAIEEVLDDGRLLANGHQVQMDAQGRVLKQTASDGSVSEFEPAQNLWWSNPLHGETRALAYKETFERADHVRGRTEYKGTTEVGRPRRIELPAGDFDVLPLQSSGWYEQTLAGGSRSAGRFSRTVWYSTQLGHPVAIDIQDVDSSGKLLRRERVELLHAQSARAAP